MISGGPAAMQLGRVRASLLDFYITESDELIVEPVSGSSLREEHVEILVDWARTDLDAPFLVTSGIIHLPQPEAALAAFSMALKTLSDFELSAFYTIMTLTGSALLAMMLARRAITPEAAWTAAHVDEDYQIEHWGQDDEARDRRAGRHTEFMDCCRFLELARA